jgi:hypothetical protein
MELLRQCLAVTFVLGLLFAAVAWARKTRCSVAALGFLERRARVRRLVAVERLVLDAHHALHLVRLDNQEILLATHAQGCAQISKPAAAVSESVARGAGA